MTVPRIAEGFGLSQRSSQFLWLIYDQFEDDEHQLGLPLA